MRLAAWIASFILTLAISIFFILRYNADLPQIAADYVRDLYLGIDKTRLSQSEIDRLSASDDHDFGIGGFGDFPEVAELYQTSILSAPEKPSFHPPNYRRSFATKHPTAKTLEIVFWPKACNKEGCRYDIFEVKSDGFAAAETFVSTIRAYFLRSSKQARNGYPIFVDGDRHAYWWNGRKFEKDPVGQERSSNKAYCKTWHQGRSGDQGIPLARDIELVGVVGEHSTGALFLAMAQPICIRTGSEENVQETGNQVQLIGLHKEEATQKALSIIGQSTVLCSYYDASPTIHYSFPYACDVAKLRGDTFEGPLEVRGDQ